MERVSMSAVQHPRCSEGLSAGCPAGDLVARLPSMMEDCGLWPALSFDIPTFLNSSVRMVAAW